MLRLGDRVLSEFQIGFLLGGSVVLGLVLLLGYMIVGVVPLGTAGEPKEEA